MKGKRSKANQPANYPTVLKNIQAVLDRKKWNRAKLADKMGVEKSNVSKWLNNHTEMSISSLIRISQTLEVDPAELLAGL